MSQNIFLPIFTSQLDTRCILGARILARPGTQCNAGCTPLNSVLQTDNYVFKSHDRILFGLLLRQAITIASAQSDRSSPELTELLDFRATEQKDNSVSSNA